MKELSFYFTGIILYITSYVNKNIDIYVKDKNYLLILNIYKVFFLQHKEVKHYVDTSNLKV